MKQIIASIFDSNFSEFTQSQYRKEPVAKPNACPAIAGTFNLQMLEEIIQVHNDCWLVKCGKLRETARSGRVCFEEFLEGYEMGETLVVRHSERAHPFLESLASEFREKYQAPVDIQLYVTPSQSEGFNWHYDVEDVFLYQTVGVKEFFLKKNKGHALLAHDQLPTCFNLNDFTEGPELRCTLKPGDHLYIPAGYWHKARAISTSFHISVGVMNQPIFTADYL